MDTLLFIALFLYFSELPFFVKNRKIVLSFLMKLKQMFKKIPVRKPEYGDCIIIMNDNVLKGRAGFVDWVSENTPSFSMHDKNSKIILPHKLGDKITPPVIYKLDFYDKIFKNK